MLSQAIYLGLFWLELIILLNPSISFGNFTKQYLKLRWWLIINSIWIWVIIPHHLETASYYPRISVTTTPLNTADYYPQSQQKLNSLRYPTFYSNAYTQQRLGPLQGYAGKTPSSGSAACKASLPNWATPTDSGPAKSPSASQELPLVLQVNGLTNILTKKNWDMFKAVFLIKFAMKDSEVVIMTELKTFKMTGTIEDYIAAYKGLHDQALKLLTLTKQDHNWTSTMASPHTLDASLT
ncbi:hypothetical protein DSO57_1016070 [Entomophthora muscae]|uniref:Uncharacterized protein n=1 Tax=Entomophthora muscae TaxID=34485 RepID=A0ACC2RJR1_9FUNG|nr:hypothetical protein DSO57_1016070 [Entomophthora muscae]